MDNFKIGSEVVRTKGDYVVGRVGNILAIDYARGRAQVAWKGENKTWVSFNSLAPTSIPYKIIAPDYSNPNKKSYPKYELA